MEAYDKSSATPEEHARETGNVLKLRSRRTINGVTLGETFTAGHMAAAQMHGWAAHKLATTDPMKLSQDDYLAAIEAALLGGEAHAPANSQFVPQMSAAPAVKRKARR